MKSPLITSMFIFEKKKNQKDKLRHIFSHLLHVGAPSANASIYCGYFDFFLNWQQPKAWI